MGSSKAEPYAESDEFPQHEVTLSGFVIMEREANQALYENVMGLSPSYFSGCDPCPVEMVSWDEAVTFAAAVSALTEESWRLPTEAEWEYAARGGEGFGYAGSDDVDAVAWANNNSGGTTHLGCELAANGYGLCDMSGNVWEWVSDWYADDYPSEAQQDPAGPLTGSDRVVRGASWASNVLAVRVSNRYWGAPSDGYADYGLRLVRSE